MALALGSGFQPLKVFNEGTPARVATQKQALRATPARARVLAPKRSGPVFLSAHWRRARIWGAGAALIPSSVARPLGVRAVMRRAHPRTLEDRTARLGPLELGDDEPADEVEGSDRALPIPFGLVALEVRFRPAGLALLRRELGVARTRVMLRKSRTRLRTRALRVSFLRWAAFRSKSQLALLFELVAATVGSSTLLPMAWAPT
jgi:hypothetical protein